MALGTQIPSQIVTKLTPLLSKQIDTMSKLAETMSSDSLNLSPEVTCSDPNVKKIKTDLQLFQKEISRLNSIVNNTNGVVNSIKTISIVANTSKLAQLIIPAVSGVPSGPVTALINLFTKLGENANSAITCLENVIKNIKSQQQLISNTVADVLNTLGPICDSEVFETSSEVADIITDTNLNLYPTEFYTEINVSDDDITNRFEVISNLLENQINVLNNLLEAPSKVYQGNTFPDIELGKVDDYYINTITNQIYGPKTINGWGTPVN